MSAKVSAREARLLMKDSEMLEKDLNSVFDSIRAKAKEQKSSLYVDSMCVRNSNLDVVYNACKELGYSVERTESGVSILW